MVHHSVDPQISLKPPRRSFTFLTIPFEFRDCETWPTAQKPTAVQIKRSFPDLSGQEAETQAQALCDRFDRLMRAIRAYLVKGSLKHALLECRCTKDVFYTQLNRCLLPNPHTGEGIVGWAGLVSHLRLKSYTRVNAGAGTAGQFQKWIQESSDWKSVLDRMILKGNGGQSMAARKPDVRGVAKNFINAFRSVNAKTGMAKIPLGTYPNDGKGFARRSIERYIESFVEMHSEATAAWFGEDVANRVHLGTGEQSFNLATAPFDVLGTDAHTTDAVGMIILQGPSGPQQVPVTRIQIVVNICHTKRVVTGYSVCIRPQIEAAHIEEAYLMGTTPWIPKLLTIEGLQYDKDAGFPCGSVEGITEINPASIRLDNAAQHYAGSIRTRLRQSLGCAVAWGGVGHWWRNAITERFFGVLEQYGFQRLPSSMGTGHQDPHRSNNPVLEATGRGIEWDELIQLIDVLLANYNARPHSALGGNSPLQSLRNSLTARHVDWFPRMRPPDTFSSPRIGIQIERHKIAGNVQRRIPPYVEIGEVRYTDKCLSSRYDWLGQPVHIHIPPDCRTVQLYLDSGEFVGQLTCMDRGWSMSAHPLQLRKTINMMIRKGELWVSSGGDPIASYLDYLSRKAMSNARETRTVRISADASSVANVQLKTGASLPMPEICKTPAKKSVFKAGEMLGISLPDGWE